MDYLCSLEPTSNGHYNEVVLIKDELYILV